MSTIKNIKINRKRLLSFITMTLVVVACFGTLTFFDDNVVSAASTSDFDFYKQLWVQSAQVPGNLDYFPVLVYTASDSDLVGLASEDIAFFDNYTAGATQLYHEIEKFTSGTGELVAWVNVTNISSSVNTSFYMFYSDADGTSEESTNTWDSSYVFVGHLNEGTGNCLDSTSNSNDGSYAGDLPDDIAGVAGDGQDMDGTGDYIAMVAGSHVSSVGTVELWVEFDDLDEDMFLYYDYSSASDRHKIQSDISESYYTTLGTTDSTVNWEFNSVATTTTSWTFFANAWSVSNDMVLWFNGGVDTVDTSYSADVYAYSAFNVGAHSNGAANFVDGTMDEVRVSNVRRSNNYLETVYNNINNKTTFVDWGINTTKVDSDINLVLNSDKFTHTGELGNTTFSNSSSTFEWAEFNFSYVSNPIEYLRINITDIHTNITASNCSYQFSSDNVSWGANWTSGADGGFTITVNASTWLEASGFFGVNPFDSDTDADGINGIEGTTSIWMVEKITIPLGIGEETYSSATGTSRTWDAGEYL